MQLKSRVFQLFCILLLTAGAIASLFLLELFGGKSKTPKIPIPKTANWVIRVDAATFVKEELYTLLFVSKDDQLLESIEQMIKDRTKRKGKNGPLYIDYQSDLVVFGTTTTSTGSAASVTAATAVTIKHDFVGMVFQLEKPEIFAANISMYLKKNQTVAVHENMAIILTQTDTIGLPKRVRQNMVNDYINNSPKRDFNALKKSSNELISMSFSSLGQVTKANNIQLGIENFPHQIRLTGEMEIDASEIHLPHYSLRSTGVFISTSIIPQGLADTINRLLPLGSYHFPELNALTLDYQGLSVDQTPTGILPLPKVNLILESKENIRLDEIFASLPKEIVGVSNTIILGSVVYHVKQLNEKTIFIGIDPKAIRLAKNPPIAIISGKLDALTKLSGSPFVLAFIEVLPQFQSGKSFVNGTETIDLKIVKKSGDTYTMKGAISFKEQVFPLNEVTKLLIGLNVIN